jgi:hypothetical protein
VLKKFGDYIGKKFEEKLDLNKTAPPKLTKTVSEGSAASNKSILQDDISDLVSDDGELQYHRMISTHERATGYQTD